ncbi:MAG: thioesterase family protein [Candidatus Lernaella stagnicola]|nr:thioesterase family protein [Candidatus Lernaella stagnicola]
MSQTDKPTALAEYTGAIRFQMHWGEMDAFGHLNNTIYFRYFESARIVFFETLDITERGMPRAIGPILGYTSCRFKAPLTFPDTLWAATRVTDIQDDRFTVEHVVYSEKLERIAAVGEATIVAYDYRNNTKATLPDSWRDCLENC